jgi:hypothetical protein
MCGCGYTPAIKAAVSPKRSVVVLDEFADQLRVLQSAGQGALADHFSFVRGPGLW